MVETSPAASAVSDERALVDGLRRGHVPSFDRAYALYASRIHSFLLRLSGRHDVAEDLSQETWLKLSKAAPTLRDDTRLSPLLFTIARNAFISHRRWALLDLSRLVIAGFDAAATASGPDEAHERSERMLQLEAALQKMPIASREILLLVGVEGLDHETVAAIVGISYDAMRQRLSRARAQLQEAMDRLERERPQRRPQEAKP